MNINKALDKAWEGKSFKEILDAPVDVLQGVSAGDGVKLKEAFNIQTVRDLAMCKYFVWARSILDLAETEE